MSTKLCLSWMAACAMVGICLLAGSASADVVVTLQQGALLPTQAGGNGTTTYSGTTDAHLREPVPDGYVNNTGGSPWLVVGQYGNGDEAGDVRALIDFDYGTLSAYMQANNLEIKSAKLKMYLQTAEGSSSTTGQTVDLFKSATAFSEGTGGTGNYRDGRAAEAGESCFAYQTYNTAGWAGGGSHSAADWGVALDTGISLTSSDFGTWKTFNVTGAYAADGSDLTADHAGITMLARVDDANPFQDNTSGGKQFCFLSRNSSSNCPTLEFTLQQVPEPSVMVILMTGLVGLLAYAWRKRK
jgi:hypothetical protein